MARPPDTTSGHHSGEGLTAAQRRSVLRVAAVTVCLPLTVPAYYVVVEFVPVFGAVVPAFVVHLSMALGLCVLFPLTLFYAWWLDETAAQGRDSSEEFGVNDRWERQNL